MVDIMDRDPVTGKFVKGNKYRFTSEKQPDRKPSNWESFNSKLDNN